LATLLDVGGGDEDTGNPCTIFDILLISRARINEKKRMHYKNFENR
jgi:hypothetical protein